jgi:hypothetical protein
MHAPWVASKTAGADKTMACHWQAIVLKLLVLLAGIELATY